MRHVPSGSATEAIKPPSMEDLWYAHALQWSAAFLMVNRRFPLPKEKFSLKPSCDESYEVCLYLILSPHLSPSTIQHPEREDPTKPTPPAPASQRRTSSLCGGDAGEPSAPLSWHCFTGVCAFLWRTHPKHVNLRMRKSSTSEYFWATWWDLGVPNLETAAPELPCNFKLGQNLRLWSPENQRFR